MRKSESTFIYIFLYLFIFLFDCYVAVNLSDGKHSGFLPVVLTCCRIEDLGMFMMTLIFYLITVHPLTTYRKILCQCATLSCEGAARDGTRNCQVQVGDQHLHKTIFDHME